MSEIKIEGEVFLAPLAGISDLPFRLLAGRFGADRTTTEMVSGKGLYYKDQKTASLMQTDPNEVPVALQIFGRDPEILSEVTRNILNARKDFWALDLNLGCPAPKIVKNREGSALLREPERAEAIVAALVEASEKPVTVKIRLGFSEKEKNYLEVARRLEAAGASMITLHARTTEQGYSGKADWEAIRKLVRTVSIPVVGNGDITSYEDYERMKDYTGCAAVAIGRAAQGRPWIFREIREKKAYEPPYEERLMIIRQHAQEMVRIKGERIALREMRKHIAWYLKGIAGGNRVKKEIFQATTMQEVTDLLQSLS